MKAQSPCKIKLDFNTVVEEIRANEKAKELIQEFEDTYGAISKSLFDQVTDGTESIYLDCDYLKPDDLPKQIADEFIKIWFTVLNSIVMPAQNGDLSIRLFFINKNGDIENEIAFETINSEQIPGFYLKQSCPKDIIFNPLFVPYRQGCDQDGGSYAFSFSKAKEGDNIFFNQNTGGLL